MRGSKVPIVFSLFFLVIFIVPIFYLVFGSWILSPGEMNWGTLAKILTSPNTGVLLGNTLMFAIGGGILATVLATTYAWLVVRTDVPGKRVLQLLPILPLTMPFLVKAFAWIYLFGPEIGVTNVVLTRFLGLPALFNIYSMAGMIFALGVGGVPLAYLTIEPAIKAMNPALEEASRVSGNGVLKTLFKVTIPILLPAILSAFLLLTIIGLENFDYPFVLGTKGGARIETLATQVYFLIHESLPPRFGTAALTSIIYLIITIIAVTIYMYITRQTYKFVVVTGKAPHKTVHSLHRWKYVGLAVCLIVMLFAFLLPFATLVIMAFTPFGSITVSRIELTFTLQNYIDAFNLHNFFNAIGNSITLGLVAGLAGTLIATFLSYAALKSKVRGARVIELVNSIPLAFPGIVYGLALFWTFLFIPGLSHLIYGTIWPLVLALIFVRLPYCVRMISGSLIQIADELEESARVSGASWGNTFSRVLLPLMKGGLINSFTYTFVNSLRELGAVVLLVTGETTVLTTLLMQYFSQHGMGLHVVAAASVFLAVIIMIALAFASIIQGVSTRQKSKSAQKLEKSIRKEV